jgi:imidazole glycerol phosphate synthase glutamine amidotransferase subunit
VSDVVIVDSGVANLASVRAGLARAGVAAEVTSDPARVRAAKRIVLPGVGAFGAAAATLRAHGLDVAIRDALGAGTPLLAICLGLQLLATGSDESPGVPGLGILEARVRRLPEGVRLPHLGWNRVTAEAGSHFLESGDAAFANSYALAECPEGWTPAWSTHGAPFVAALERGKTLLCQFHPELSGAWGRALLARWLGDAAPRTTSVPRARGAGLTRRVIACLDVKDGRVVKGIKFQALRDAGDPAERAGSYESQGADEIVVLDVGASPEGRATQVETVRRVRAELSIPLTVGGGVRSVDDARALLAAGADKVAVNTSAVREPALVSRTAEALGSQCVVLAVDARRAGASWEVLVSGGREPAGRDAIEWLEEGVRLGAGEILLTSWDADGTRAGCDLELLSAASRAVTVPVIASGGIGTQVHALEALRSGADAVLAASIFHDGDMTVAGLKSFLSDNGVVVRS